MTIPKIPFVFILVLLNAVPVYGVLAWDWQSFDLIFLYWLENLIIGVFTILRFVVRRYHIGMEVMYPICMAPFFALHYGLFCYGHGVFIINLFGGETLTATQSHSIFGMILPLVEERHLFWPVIALAMFQLLDWVRDVSERGLANDGLREMMMAPYRRIMVLHITIICSGFVLTALQEPMAGLLILVLLKTAFDIYHWNRDESSIEQGIDKPLDQKTLHKIDAFLENPVFTVNGTEKRFDNYDDLKASDQYATMLSIYRLLLGSRQLDQVERYIEQGMNDRSQQA